MAKRIWIWAAMAALTLAVGSAATVSAQCLTPPGDINQDGITNIADIQCAILVAVHLAGDPQFPTLPSCLQVPPEVADTNCDGTINVSDLVLLVTYAIELPLSPLVDANGSGCPDACEVAGSSLLVPAVVTGSSSGATYMLDALGTGVQATGSSSGGGLTLSPKVVGLTEN